VSGKIAGQFQCQSTGQWRWDDAEAVAGEWLKNRSWPLVVPQPQPVRIEQPEPSVPTPTRTELTEVFEAFLDKYRNQNVESSTIAKYKTLTNQLTAYCEKKVYRYIDEFRVVDMDSFYGSWKDGIKGKAKKLERLKSFSKFCVVRDWLAKDITSDLKAPSGASENNQKAPFEDDELLRIYDACDEIGPPTKFGPGYRTWSGEDAKDFIYLSIYTGLRISDVATFDTAKRLKGNDVFLRMHKTGKPLYTWIPDWLVARLRDRERLHGPRIFLAGVTQNAKQLCDIWRNKRLKKVFELAGPFEEKATPHRFRHTFVRILLEKGVPVADVAELIGDTEEMVRRHYAKSRLSG
jgi:integrase